MFTSSTLAALLLAGAGICARAEITPLGERAGGAVVGDVLAGGYTDGITVSAENVTQCGYASISWTGAAAPATLEIGQGGYYVGTTSIANLTAGWDNTTQWLVTQPAGTDLIFQIVGADGKTGYAQNIQVGEGGEECLGNGTVGRNGTSVTNGSSAASESSTETASSTDTANSTLSAASSDTTAASAISTTSGTTTLPSSAAASASSASQVIVTVGGSASSGSPTPASGATTAASSGDSSASLLAANDSASTAGASTTSGAASGAGAGRSISGAVLAGAAGVVLGAVAGVFA